MPRIVAGLIYDPALCVTNQSIFEWPEVTLPIRPGAMVLIEMSEGRFIIEGDY